MFAVVLLVVLDFDSCYLERRQVEIIYKMLEGAAVNSD